MAAASVVAMAPSQQNRQSQVQQHLQQRQQMQQQQQQQRSSALQRFQEFRQEKLDSFNDFRSKVLDHYSEFLEQAWQDYEQFRGLERDNTPKPKVLPDVAEDPDPVVIPEPVVTPEPEPEPVVTPEPEPEPVVTPEPEPVVTPEPEPEPVVTPEPEPEPVVTPEPEPEPVVTPEPEPEPVVTPEPEPEPVVTPVVTPVVIPTPSDTYKPKPGDFKFDFYGMEVGVPKVEVSIQNSLANTADYAYQWKQLAQDSNSKKLISNLQKTAKEMNLNDFLTYAMVKDYVVAKYPNVSSSSQMSLVHYIMANMGYNARIAMLDNEAVILIAPEQTLYSRPYLQLDGNRYYVFQKDNNNVEFSGKRIATCNLPKEANMSKKVSFVIDDLKIPYKAKSYDIAFGDIKISGEVNANLFPILYRYPQMDIKDYAESNIYPSLRQDIARQVQSQVSSLPQQQAVDKVLRFVQKGFEYQTDDDQFGFEKPYFFEEMLHYGKCDCEDRAVFYSYLLWNSLGVRNHIINYPGHEAVSASIDAEISNGRSYEDQGRRYYISDPTYIGSSTGMCMPSYKKTEPRVDYRYQ